MAEQEKRQLSDTQLIELYKAGKTNEAFRLIVQKYKERLYWLVRGMCNSHQDTDDILQNTFIKVWRFLPGFRGESQLYTWLYRIAANEAVTFLNKKRIVSLFTISSGSNNSSDKSYNNSYNNSHEPVAEETTFSGNAIQSALHREILRLPPKQRAIFNLRYFQETKFSDIAAIMGRSEGAVKASYHLAYKKIKEKLLEEF